MKFRPWRKNSPTHSTSGISKPCSTCFQTTSRCLIPFPIGSTAGLFLPSFSTRGFRGYRLNKLRLSAAILPRLQRYCGNSECLRHVQWCHQGRQADRRRWPNHLDLCQTGHAMEDCKLPLLAHASYALKEPREHAEREHADRKRC